MAFPGVSLYVLLGRGKDYSLVGHHRHHRQRGRVRGGAVRAGRLGAHPRLGALPLQGRLHADEGAGAHGHARPGPRRPTRAPSRRRSSTGCCGPCTGRCRAPPRSRASRWPSPRRARPTSTSSSRPWPSSASTATRSPTPRSFQSTMGTINFLFNWFYNDERDIAYLQSGWFPLRAPGTDPSLPTLGTGPFDWRGFDPAAFTSQRAGVRPAPEGHQPAARLHRELEQQAGARLARRRRRLELQLGPALRAARGPCAGEP